MEPLIINPISKAQALQRRSLTCFELNWPLKKDRSLLSHPKGWKRVKETHFYVISLSCNHFWVLSFFLEFSLTLKVVWSTGHFFTFTELFIDYRVAIIAFNDGMDHDTSKEVLSGD